MIVLGWRRGDEEADMKNSPDGKAMADKDRGEHRTASPIPSAILLVHSC